MALHLDPQGEPDPVRDAQGVAAGDLADSLQVVSHGTQRIAHGALICPACRAPTVITESVAAGSSIGCGYCGEHARAREFVVEDVYDTPANEVYLVARIR